jgi:high-affinity Fe2+/Pb2+ permease
MTILTRILSFIPQLVVVLLVTLLLIYKPHGYQVVVGAFAFAYLIFAPLLWLFARRSAKKKKTEKAVATRGKNIAAPTGHY